MLSLPYGRVPYPLDRGNRVAHVLEPTALPPPRPVEELLESALSASIGASIPDASHVTIIVSDITRDEPRPAFLRALRRLLPHARWTILAPDTGSLAERRLCARWSGARGCGRRSERRIPSRRRARAAMVHGSSNTCLARDRLRQAAGHRVQAAKIASACAPIIAENGDLVVVAECVEGVEPLETVNEPIFRIGVLPRLARGVRLQRVSALPDAEVTRTLLRPVSSLAALVRNADSIVVVPRASQLTIEPSS